MKNLKSMRALNYIKRQIEFAVKGTGKITVNQNLIDAFNEVAEYVNSGTPNTNVEDSLILFYLLQQWKVDNLNNKLRISNGERGVFLLSDTKITLENLFMSAKPKENMIDEIFTELRVYQLYNKFPKEKFIKKKEVRILLDELLKNAKNFNTFDLIKSKIQTYGRAD